MGMNKHDWRREDSLGKIGICTSRRKCTIEFGGGSPLFNKAEEIFRIDDTENF
ncbi:MAG: hypothetical protein N3G21_09780 [Candidatus Hydrogenedentes bacterium]|nr:hypothetical protein [Candidatus Hydrogenedentota bacterium]